MACSKHGSRVLEALWKVASMKAKTQVCSELVADELKLKDNLFGKIIFNNFQVRRMIRLKNLLKVDKLVCGTNNAIIKLGAVGVAKMLLKGFPK